MASSSMVGIRVFVAVAVAVEVGVGDFAPVWGMGKFSALVTQSGKSRLKWF